MNHIDTSPVRHTSVTLRTGTHASLRDAGGVLAGVGLKFSEQRLMRECLRLALKLWRGRRQIAARNRKYNRCAGPYEIVPLYTTEALRSAACARCHHAGVSLSRLMDFAVACYLPRVLEYWLRFDHSCRNAQDAQIWREKYALRRNSADFVISYQAVTEKNDGFRLEFRENTEILPWPPPDEGVKWYKKG